MSVADVSFTGRFKNGRSDRFVLGLLLLIGGKLLLAFEFQLELGLGQLLLKTDDTRKQLRVSLFQYTDLAKRVFPSLVATICDLHERTQRGTAQMWAVSHIRTRVFVFGVKAK